VVERERRLRREGCRKRWDKKGPACIKTKKKKKKKKGVRTFQKSDQRILDFGHKAGPATSCQREEREEGLRNCHYSVNGEKEKPNERSSPRQGKTHSDWKKWGRNAKRSVAPIYDRREGDFLQKPPEKGGTCSTVKKKSKGRKIPRQKGLGVMGSQRVRKKKKHHDRIPFRRSKGKEPAQTLNNRIREKKKDAPGKGPRACLRGQIRL